ncbi:hypothetical protein A7982_12798 [Minicystis rosea]|nr:hypothetical protein A7982_12798 [Minicystis rosea]
MDNLFEAAPAHATTILIFPDDFPDGAVIALVDALRRARPRLLILLVTRAPARFRASFSANESRSLMPLVLPKPLRGSIVLDAIRGHAAGREL